MISSREHKRVIKSNAYVKEEVKKDMENKERQKIY